MPLGDYLEGLAFFVVTTGAVTAAAAIVVSRRLRHLGWVDRLLAFAGLATALLIGAHLLPGLFGVLSRWTAAGSALVFLALVWWLVRRNEGAEPGRTERLDWRSLRARGWWLWGAAATSVLAVLVWSIAEG